MIGIDKRAFKGIWWWGYLHANGHVQVKRWFGDVKDYTEDCWGNDFVQIVVEPFVAATQEAATAIIVANIREKTGRK